MPATDPEPTSMEERRALEDEGGTSTNVPSSVPSSTPPDPTTNHFPSEAMVEKKAVSMASNDCSAALSSPAEASPAKPAATSPTTTEGTVKTSPATSPTASASHALTCTATSLIDVSQSPLSSSVPASTAYGGPDRGKDFPAVLTFKGVSVTLENNSVWKQFYSCGTEMILTKQGRRMFPYCRYRLSGLDPERKYTLVLSILPTDQHRYRWNTNKWEVTGEVENQTQGLIRAFSHHYSPCLGSEWMGTLVSFYKLKLTNHSQDQDGHIILHSMHRYIPRLHVIPVPDGEVPTASRPFVMGPESMTFTFPQTEFMAVTTYQNFRITQLKINHNPFAKGFREDGHNSRLNRIILDASAVAKTQTQPDVSKPEELSENKEQVMDLSTKTPTVSGSLSNEPIRLVLKPIMSTCTKDEQFVPCLRGKHSLGELVLVERPLVEPKEEPQTPISVTPASFTSTPSSSPAFYKRRKRINRRWANSRGKMWKAAPASPAVSHSPSLTVAMQPELDDVEGLLFVSFTSKEALEVHVGEKPTSSTPATSPVSPTTPVQVKVEVVPETDEEKRVRLEAVLLQDLKILKHRQVIHPVLQEVGLKLSSLDPMKSIDLQYLGVRLPLPPPNLPESSDATTLTVGENGLSFISRTGKTSDMTKIKGWKNKFIRNKETSPNRDGSQKNLSAFCSNMLDEYLESEAQYISERAAAFTTSSEESVAYQLPVKSSSYVKTLDSVLKHRKAAPKFPAGANRPCPLSHKPLLYSALASPAPPLVSPERRVQSQPTQQSAASHAQQEAQRSSPSHPAVSPRLAVNFGQSHMLTHRHPGLNKIQARLTEMEFAAVNQGLRRTQVTPERLSMALSGLLTKQMQHCQVSKSPKYTDCERAGPECGQEFCTLGCVCSSLKRLSRVCFHCRRPECMFGCTCLKRKITKHLTGVGEEVPLHPVYSMTTAENLIHPRSHVSKLWNRDINDVDPEPIFTPESSPLCSPPAKVLKRIHPQRQIQEEEKDPVYRYFESMMTCARVREFNSKPPVDVPLEFKIPDASTPNTTAKPQITTTDDLPKTNRYTPLDHKAADKSFQEATCGEKDAHKQIHIQSECHWANDRTMVVEALYRRMEQNRLSRRFWAGPYRICPLSRIFMKKPSGNIITYRVHISKPSKASDNDEEDDDDSDEERDASKSSDGDTDMEEDDGQNEEPKLPFGITPFMTGVMPAGRLRARTKPVGCQANGLIQVNGKSYNNARLLLGNMGSLHPANRLAAFVTGRLRPPGGISLKVSQKHNPTNKITTPDTPHIKAAGTAVPPVITVSRTTDLKMPSQPPAQPLASWRGVSNNLPQHSQNSFPVNPFGQRSLVKPFQNSSTSSPVSLTVSQSLKTPSFLGQSGTYSFRICPPANKSTRGQNMPGVTLPGGFTLIELPKPGAGASESTNTAGAGEARPPRDALINFGHLLGLSDAKRLCSGAVAAAMQLSASRSVQPGCSSELRCDQKIPSDKNERTNGRQVEANLDITSEDSRSDSESESDSDSDSDSSDYEDDGVVDIETVEETTQPMAITQLREAVRKALKDSGDSSDGFTSVKEPNAQDKRRKNHTVLERLRRSEQRVLFDKLQDVLRSEPKTPRLLLLTLALREIQSLVQTSKYLEEKKRNLMRMQSVYVKELSLLSGKSDVQIKNKLQEICLRQKIRETKKEWSPFFSNLLQSRAAMLQNTTTTPKLPKRPPLLLPDLHKRPAQATTLTPAAQKLMSLLQQNHPQLPTLPKLPGVSPAHAVVTAASPHGAQRLINAEQQRATPAAPSQMFTMKTNGSVAAPPWAPAVPDGAPAVGFTPVSSKPPAKSQPSLALPLIRSKNGRLILPSSLKPIGNGFYTLMVMQPKQDGKEDKVSSGNTPPSALDSSVSECDKPLDPGSIKEEDKRTHSSSAKPQQPGVKPPLAELSLLNKSILLPTVALSAVDGSQTGGAAGALNQTRTTACLSFNPVNPVLTSAEPDPAPPRRGRGRPPKIRTTISGEESEKSPQTRTILPSSLKPHAKDSNDSPIPVKRGRGRPPLRKSQTPGGGPPKSREESPEFKSPDIRSKKIRPGGVGTSRPLTRGALGKDFPSAKKRSWIDVEKELDPDGESDLDSDSG